MHKFRRSITALSTEIALGVDISTSTFRLNKYYNTRVESLRVRKQVRHILDPLQIVHQLGRAHAGLVAAMREVPEESYSRLTLLLSHVALWQRQMLDHVKALVEGSGELRGYGHALRHDLNDWTVPAGASGLADARTALQVLQGIHSEVVEYAQRLSEADLAKEAIDRAGDRNTPASLLRSQVEHYKAHTLHMRQLGQGAAETNA